MGRKKVVAEEKLQNEIPSDTIAQVMSQNDTLALVHAFDNNWKKEGIETLSMLTKITPDSPALYRLGNDIVAFSRLSDSFSLQQYFNRHGIFRSTIERYKKVCPYFSNCIELAKEIIGTRREFWGATRAMDPGTMLRYAAIYSHDYRELREWEAGLSAKVDQGATTINVSFDRSRNNEQPISDTETIGRDRRSKLGNSSITGEDEAEGTDIEE